MTNPDERQLQAGDHQGRGVLCGTEEGSGVLEHQITQLREQIALLQQRQAQTTCKSSSTAAQNDMSVVHQDKGVLSAVPLPLPYPDDRRACEPPGDCGTQVVCVDKTESLVDDASLASTQPRFSQMQQCLGEGGSVPAMQNLFGAPSTLVGRAIVADEQDMHQDVTRLVAQVMTKRNIGEALGSSPNTSDQMNAALAQFQHAASLQLSRGGVENSSGEHEAPLDMNEREELDRFRDLFSSLTLGDVGQVSGSGESVGIRTSSSQTAPAFHHAHGAGGGVFNTPGIFAEPSSSVQVTLGDIPEQFENAQNPFDWEASRARINAVIARQNPQTYRGMTPANPANPVNPVNPVPFQSRPIGEALTGQGPTLVPREVKLEKPLTFSGKRSELQNFMYVMRAYVDSVGLGNGSRACRYFVSFLRGDALTWWRSHSRDSMAIFDTLEFDDLCEAVLTQFSDIDRDMKLRDRLFSLRQSGNVAQYITHFRQLQLELGSARLHDDVALHLFINGLKSFTQQWVLMQRPENFEDACVLAERADACVSRRQNGGWQQPQQQQNRGRPNYSNVGHRNVSQYSNSRYKGQAPMVLGMAEQQPGGKPVCYHCNRPGHYKRDCFLLNKSRGGHSNANRGNRGKQQTPPPPPPPKN